MAIKSRRWNEDEKGKNRKNNLKDGGKQKLHSRYSNNACGVEDADSSGNSKNTSISNKRQRQSMKVRVDHMLDRNIEEIWNKPSRTVVLVCALCVGIINGIHVSTMFENDRHFSHLSTLEREMTFRTEMGLYYSYYKTLVGADTFTLGLHKLMHDNLTEYPNTINTLERFNLFPEVILGGSYRLFKTVLDYFNFEMQICWQVTRGDNLPPVVSCEGIGDPTYWYINGVWLCAGLTGALVFLYGCKLSQSLGGGFVATLCFFYNHGEATRVQWAPPLRESFAYPICLMLNLVATEILRRPNKSLFFMVVYGILTAIYLLCWQFAQFTLVITISIFYFMYTFGMMDSLHLIVIIFATMTGFLNTVVLQFGNAMLLTSLLGACLVGITLLYLFVEPVIRYLPAPTNMCMQFVFLFVATAACKIEISWFLGVTDDSHIFNLLKSKFTNYTDFYSLLYTCSPEFDFMPQETVYKLSETLLIPCVICVGGALLVSFLLSVKFNMLKRLDEDRDCLTPLWAGTDPAVIFNVLLLIVYAVMAFLIMRLKLFLTPQLCIVASLIMCRKYWPNIKRKDVHLTIVVVLLSAMSVKGIRNIYQQRSIVGEYSDPNLEELIEWINQETTPNDVFSGPMPTMANILLSTRRPVVNHPHFEHAGLRDRTKRVYSVCSRKSPEKVYEILVSMKVNYVVLDETWCLHKSKPGCGMVDLWDVEEPHMYRKPALCPKLFHHTPPPFHKVFSNEQYVVLQVPSKYVQIPAPRTQKS